METILKLLMENPNMVMPLVKDYIAKYKPIVYELGNELLKVYKDYANNEEYFRTVASVRKNMFDAYVEAGFSEDQAMTFMLNSDMQMKEQLSTMNKSLRETRKA